MDKETGKFYFCEKCGKYPNKIIETYNWAVEEREWNGNEYELIDYEAGDCIVKCGVCDTICIDKYEG